MTVDEFNKKAMDNFHQRVLSDMEEKLNHYKMLAKYTKKSVKLNHHKLNIKFMEEVIVEAKKEYGLS